MTDVGQKGSTLEAWFRLNQRLKKEAEDDPDGDEVEYPLYWQTPETFVWNPKTSEFDDPKYNVKRVGRMHQVSPQQPDLFHL